jgi:antitoxin (DNA-binding transcriptional repressor) of toxin-antitoxin stability system
MKARLDMDRIAAGLRAERRGKVESPSAPRKAASSINAALRHVDGCPAANPSAPLVGDHDEARGFPVQHVGPTSCTQRFPFQGLAPFDGEVSDYHVPMESHISATEAARTFSDLLSRVRYRGESFVIERGGEVIGRLGPAGPTSCTGEELARLLKSLPPVDEEYAKVIKGLAKKQPRLPRNPWGR